MSRAQKRRESVGCFGQKENIKRQSLYYCYLNNPEKDLECLKAEPAATRSKKNESNG